MAIGIIGTINGGGTVTYSPNNPAKVSILYNGSAGATINGASCISPNTSTGAQAPLLLWVGAGQTLTITMSSGSAVISALEG